MPITSAWLGDYIELVEVNGTFVLEPEDDLDGEEIHGQAATCKYSFDVVSFNKLLMISENRLILG